jgi:pimeloyl-ACP methyl ester carboxylesterase
MKKGWKITLIIIASLVLLILVGPFLIPVPPLGDTQPASALADPDSQFIEINDINVHYKRIGFGEPVFILLHGFGASTFSWREVMTPLSDYGMVIAYDRPAFGLTERPMTWEGDNPYTMESNIALLLGLMDAMSVDEAILVGNSAGGTLATAFTLAHPDRVQALIEVNAAIYQTRPESTLLNWLFQTPQMDHIGPLISRQLAGSQGDAFLESAWYDPSKLEANPEIIAGYRKPLMVEHWDRALWEHTKASTAPGLAESLGQIKAPVLIIAGENDQIVPVENSHQLAEDLQNSTLTVVQNCGHVPQEECPVEFLVSVENFIIRLLEE